MGNQIEKAMDAAKETMGEDGFNEKLDAIISKIDNVTNNEDNNTVDDAEDAQGQEEPTASVDELREVIAEQDKKIDKLLDAMGRMVTRYGAQVSDDSREEISNTSLDDSEDEIPLLSELKLG